MCTVSLCCERATQTAAYLVRELSVAAFPIRLYTGYRRRDAASWRSSRPTPSASLYGAAVVRCPKILNLCLSAVRYKFLRIAAHILHIRR